MSNRTALEVVLEVMIVVAVFIGGLALLVGILNSAAPPRWHEGTIVARFDGGQGGLGESQLVTLVLSDGGQNSTVTCDILSMSGPDAATLLGLRQGQNVTLFTVGFDYYCYVVKAG